MTSRPHLVPTLVVDRNGKLTTVHKKDAASAQSKNFALPELKSGNSLEHDGFVERVLNKCQSLIGGMGQSSNEESTKIKMTRTLNRYKTDLLIQIEEALGKDDSLEEYEGIGSEIYDLLYEGQSANLIKEVIYFYPMIHDEDRGAIITVDLIKGLHYPEHLPRNGSFADADEETRSKCHSLLKVAAALYQQVDFVDNAAGGGIRFGIASSITIKDDRVVELALEHKDDPEKLVAIIDQGFSEYGSINAVLRGENPALGVGAL